MRLRAGDAAWCSLLAEAVAALDSEAFHARLLEVLLPLVRHDASMVVRYSRYAAPDFLINNGFGPESVMLYLSGYYRYDPFYGLAQQGELRGVYGLHEVGGQALKRGDYRRVFQRGAGVSDELGLFLGGLGGASIALFLERASGRFTAGERALAENVFPLLAALHDQHVRWRLGALGQVQGGRPLLLLDAAGKAVHANAAWQAEESALTPALPRLEQESSLALPDGRVLHAQPLDSSFPLAPGGRLCSVEPRGLAPASLHQRSVREVFSGRLTPRELAIVELILAGHPTETIAKRLCIGRGTVKNHRRRLYYKLDITSERELFLTYIAGMTEGP